jgi:two-component sensor histidine kinase
LPEDIEQEEPESLGLNMVDTLTTQLEASLDIISNSGVTYEIEFQKQQTAGSSSSLTNMNE